MIIRKKKLPDMIKKIRLQKREEKGSWKSEIEIIDLKTYRMPLIIKLSVNCWCNNIKHEKQY